MANNCFYDLKAIGNKDAVSELVQVMNYEHSEKRCFARIFSADVIEEWELSDGRSALWIAGDCAWSVMSCMFPGGVGTYYGTGDDVRENGLSNILIESKRLGLDIEIYSTEPGIGFAEHYIVQKGKTIVDETVKYHEYWYSESEYPDFEDWKADNGLPKDFTIEKLSDGDVYIEGGFDVIFEVDQIPRKQSA